MTNDVIYNNIFKILNIILIPKLFALILSLVFKVLPQFEQNFCSLFNLQPQLSQYFIKTPTSLDNYNKYKLKRKYFSGQKVYLFIFLFVQK